MLHGSWTIHLLAVVKGVLVWLVVMFTQFCLRTDLKGPF